MVLLSKNYAAKLNSIKFGYLQADFAKIVTNKTIFRKNNKNSNYNVNSNNVNKIKINKNPKNLKKNYNNRLNNNYQHLLPRFQTKNNNNNNIKMTEK